MATRAPRPLPYLRGMGAPEAALYIGVSEGTFRTLVKDGAMPRARMILARKVWDVDELDAAFKALPRDGGEPQEVDTWADVGREF